MSALGIFLLAAVFAIVGAVCGAVEAWRERLRIRRKPLSPVAFRIVLAVVTIQGWVTHAFWFGVWAALRAYAFTRPMITARCPDQGCPIFHRWFLTCKPVDGKTGTPGRYLHHLTAPDYDRSEHNHPWSNARTRVLRGWYVETRDGVHYTRVAGDVADFDGETFHRITHVRENTWTLFTAGPKHGRGWGFADGRKARDPNGRQAGVDPGTVGGTCPESYCDGDAGHDVSRRPHGLRAGVDPEESIDTLRSSQILPPAPCLHDPPDDFLGCPTCDPPRDGAA